MKLLRWLALASLAFGATVRSAEPPATADAAPVPIEAFAALPAIEGASLSPDGTKIAAKMAIGGTQYFVVLQLLGGAKPAITKVGETVDINWWRWVGDDWLAIGVGSQDRVYGEEVYITRTLGLSADMKTINRIDWQHSGLRADDLLWTATDGSARILLSRQWGIDTQEQFYPEVIEADLSTGKVRRVTPGRADVYDWFADGRGQIRMGYRYSDDSQAKALIYRASNADNFKTIAVRKRGDETDLPIPLIFRADGTAIATSQASGLDAVYEVKVPDLTLGKKLFGVAGYDVDGIAANESRDTLDGIFFTDRFRHIEWLDPAMKLVQAEIDKAIPERRARIRSWNRDRTRFLVEVGSPSQAGALYFYDTASGVMKHFAWNNDALKRRSLSPVSTVHYAARDGTAIEAVLTLPRGREPKALPLIVLPHGGPFARDAEDWDWWVQYLAESGYAVIQPNYRGSSGYGHDFEVKAEGQWGLKMQDDLNDAAAWLAKEGIADPKRVCMVGASYGGYAAMRAAERDGTLYRCAVSFAGVSDLAAMRRYDGQFLYGKTRGAWLAKQAPDFKAVSPRFDAASFSAPILLVHGKADKRVPVKQSRAMAEALKEAGKPYEYLEQPLADHHFTRREDRLEFLEAMKAFLDKYNPA